MGKKPLQLILQERPKSMNIIWRMRLRNNLLTMGSCACYTRDCLPNLKRQSLLEKKNTGGYMLLQRIEKVLMEDTFLKLPLKYGLNRIRNTLGHRKVVLICGITQTNFMQQSEHLRCVLILCKPFHPISERRGFKSIT